MIFDKSLTILARKKLTPVKINKKEYFVANFLKTSYNFLANRLGGGIKRGFEVPKLWEGCSFLIGQKNEPNR